MLTANEGIITEESCIYKGRIALPKFVIRRAVQNGIPVAQILWSMKVVRWSVISARLTEIAKELAYTQECMHQHSNRTPPTASTHHSLKTIVFWKTKQNQRVWFCLEFQTSKK